MIIDGKTESWDTVKDWDNDRIADWDECVKYLLKMVGIGVAIGKILKIFLILKEYSLQETGNK